MATCQRQSKGLATKEGLRARRSSAQLFCHSPRSSQAHEMAFEALSFDIFQAPSPLLYSNSATVSPFHPFSLTISTAFFELFPSNLWIL